jgi:hypothetical protein
MEQSKPNTIMVDGVERPREASDGKPIAQTDEQLTKFWQWFGNSITVDEKGRPMEAHKWLQKREEEMTLSPEDHAAVNKFAHDLANDGREWKLPQIPVIDISSSAPHGIDQSGRPLAYHGQNTVNNGPGVPTNLDTDAMVSRLTDLMAPPARKDSGFKPK